MIHLRSLLTEAVSDDPDFVAYIKEQEGSKKDKRGYHVAYQDSVGKWTIGYGHASNSVKPGMKWTEAKAEEQLKRDINKAESIAKSYVAEKFPGKTLGSTQLKMLTDFAFNLGGLRKFPKFTAAVVYKNWSEAAKNYKRFAGGMELTKRNRDFYNKFLSPLLAKSSAVKKSTAGATNPTTAPKPSRIATAIKQHVWVVQSGDALSGIVDKLIKGGYRYPVSVASIKKLNALPGVSIQVGQKLKLK